MKPEKALSIMVSYSARVRRALALVTEPTLLRSRTKVNRLRFLVVVKFQEPPIERDTP